VVTRAHARHATAAALARAAALVAVALGAARALAAAPLVGDGATAQTVTLDDRAHAWHAGAAIDASAGTVRGARAAGAGQVAVDFVPPRVGAPIAVTFTVARGSRAVALGTAQVAPPPRVAHELASNGPFQLRAPDALTLGVDRSVEISYHAPSGAALRASVGHLSSPVRGKGGRWHATYTPPDAHHPQVALLVVTDGEDGPLDALALPLLGQAQIDAQTEPNARVEIRVGDVSYGPVRADAQGHARFVVIAPPGTRAVRTVAVDRAGNTIEKPLDLGAPRFARLYAVCRADRVELVAADANGRPSEAERFKLAASTGKLAEPRRVRPGVFETRLTVADDDPGLDSAVAALLADEPDQVSRCRLKLDSEWPSELRVTAARAAFVAGDGPIAVTATLRYPGRRAPRPVAIVFDADLGDVTADKEGHATWTLPGRLDGREHAALTARTAAGPARTATVRVALAPGGLTRLVLGADAGRVRADGRGHTLIGVVATDAFGNPLRASGLVATARGQLVAVDERTLGYTAPRDYVRYEDSIAVRDAGGRVSATAVVPLLPARHRFAATARVGYVTNFGKLSAPLVAAGLELRPPWLRSMLSFSVESGWYGGSSEQRTPAGETARVTIDAVPLVAQARFTLPLARFAVFAGLGGGAVFPRVVVSAPSGQSRTSSPAGLFACGAGADADVRYGRVGIDVGYWYAPLGGPDVAGNLGGLVLTAGYRYEFL
jgi:hypothetical protein